MDGMDYSKEHVRFHAWAASTGEASTHGRRIVFLTCIAGSVTFYRSLISSLLMHSQRAERSWQESHSTPLLYAPIGGKKKLIYFLYVKFRCQFR